MRGARQVKLRERSAWRMVELEAIREVAEALGIDLVKAAKCRLTSAVDARPSGKRIGHFVPGLRAGHVGEVAKQE